MKLSKRVTLWLAVSLLFISTHRSNTVLAELVAITNVRIDTRSESGTIASGSVLIRDGVIESVGTEIEIPADAKVIDGSGATLTPGWIDSQSRLWLTPTSRSDTSSTAALRTVDGLDPFDESFRDVVRQGVTAVAVSPQDRGRLGGSVALIAAGPTKSIFSVPTRESFEKESDEGDKPADSEKAKDAAKEAKELSEAKPDASPRRRPRRSPSTPTSSVPDDPEDEENDKPDGDKKEGDQGGDDKKADAKEADGKDKKEASEKDEKEEPEVPYSITRPPVPYTIGETGWVLSSDIAVQSSLGIAARDGRSRIGEFESLKKTLTDAEAYHKKWDEYRVWKAKQDKLPPEKRAKVAAKKPMTTEQRRAEMMRRIAAMRAQRSGATPKPPETKKEPEAAKKDDAKKPGESEKKEEKVVPKPDFDPAKERLRPVLKGEIPLRIAVSDNASLERALELTKIADCQLILIGVSELGEGSLDDVSWPVIAGPWMNQDAETIGFWVEQFSRDDTRVCLGSFGGSGSDSGTLRMQAAAAVAAGVDPDRVLDSVTRSAAEVAGVGNWLGQIQPGYRADLVLFDGDPLDPSSPVLHTMIAGQTVFESSLRPTDDDDSQRVAAVDEDLIERFADLRMPSAYVLESRRILRPSGKFRSGRVTVVDGEIKSVVLDPVDGKAKKAEPTGEDALPVLNLGDLVLTPGLVSAHLALSSGSATGEPDSSYYQAANGFDFQSDLARDLVKGGVLFAAIAPSSGNVLAGQISGVRLAADDPIVSDSIADKMVVASQARRSDRFPSSMEGQFAFIRRRFAGDLEPNRTEMPFVVAELMRKDAKARFAELSEGKRISVIQAETPSELRGSLRLIKALSLNARLLLPADLGAVLEQVKENKIGLIVRPATASDPDWYLQDIAEAASAGSPVGVAARDASSLRATVALMVGQGVKPQRAMKMLTSEAAACVGMPKGAATIAVGQPADLVIWSGPPYKLTSRCLGVLSDGKKIDQDDSSIQDRQNDATPTQVTAS